MISFCLQVSLFTGPSQRFISITSVLSSPPLHHRHRHRHRFGLLPHGHRHRLRQHNVSVSHLHRRRSLPGQPTHKSANTDWSLSTCRRQNPCSPAHCRNCHRPGRTTAKKPDGKDDLLAHLCEIKKIFFQFVLKVVVYPKVTI